VQTKRRRGKEQCCFGLEGRFTCRALQRKGVNKIPVSLQEEGDSEEKEEKEKFEQKIGATARRDMLLGDFPRVTKGNVIFKRSKGGIGGSGHTLTVSKQQPVAGLT